MRIEKIVFSHLEEEQCDIPFLTQTINFYEHKNKFDKRNYNLSLIIGENGTRKTTILQLISNLFNQKNSNNRFNNLKYCISVHNKNKNYTFHSDTLLKTNFDCSYLTTSILNKVSDNITSNTEFVENTSRSLVNLLLNNKSIAKVLNIVEYPITQLFDKKKVYVELIGYKSIDYNKINVKSAEKIENMNADIELQLIKQIEELSVKLPRINIRNKIFDKKIDIINQLIFLVDELIKKSSIRTKRFGVKQEYFTMPFDNFSSLNNTLNLLNSLDIPEIYTLSIRRRFGELRYVREVWIHYEKSTVIPLTQLSSGELSFISHLLDLNEKKCKNGIILIDEPELHLHPRWIISYISILDIFFKDTNSHVIVATHSPLLANKVFEENLILLKKNEGITKQIITDINPLGMRIDDLLNDVFYLDENDYFLECYKDDLINRIRTGNDFENAIKEYESLEDSLIKFDIFKKCYKEITESRGS